MTTTPTTCVADLRRKFELMFGVEITDAIRDTTLESFSFDDLASMDLDMIVSELTGAPLPNDRDKIWVTYADVEKYVIDKVNEKHDAAPH